MKENGKIITCTYLEENHNRIFTAELLLSYFPNKFHLFINIKIISIDASVKDMEAAAVAWVAEITDTPMFAIKVVTDIVDGDRPTEEEFLDNLQRAAYSLQEAIPKALEFVVGKKVTEL